MKIATRSFGEIEVPDDTVINFEHGLIGFEDLKRFVIVENADAHPFRWLQSIDNSDIALVTVDPIQFFPSYECTASPEDLVELGLESVTDAQILSVVIVEDDQSKVTLNLVAPILINIKRMAAKQVILSDTRYGVAHALTLNASSAAESAS